MGRVAVEFQKPGSDNILSEMYYENGKGPLGVHECIWKTNNKYGRDIKIITTRCYPDNGWVCPPELRRNAPTVLVKRKRGRFGRISYELDERT
jgi:hypothetical protein